MIKEAPVVVTRGDITFISYGIDINFGGGVPLHPRESVGIHVGDRIPNRRVDIEVLDAASHFYRYHPSPKNWLTGSRLCDSDYAFFFHSMVFGNDHN